ncbi:TadE/TadG family type IV pilus assembly protein [Parasphingopyxis sp. CP4]|uniref:TadE/TadG family type IV pilus assembly protein n=1 Tax=Parasphingopyxis sp. CP4 TaxID=2724527 RepID=UPI0021071BC8|nr:TadE/TadG family type IV pilus assembly protein [Parasphingopyxis sp. CP4]
MRTISFRKDERGATAAEFAMVVPLLLLLIFAVIDGGRAMYTWNRAEKATQMGVRYAAATEMVPEGLETYSFVTNGGIPQGQLIGASAFGGTECSSTGGTVTCTCHESSACPTGSSPFDTVDSTAFQNIVARMNAIMPEIGPDNVVIEYNYSGLGYAGDPNGPDVAPLVVVRLRNVRFEPATFFVFGGGITLPDFRAALTLEDGAGALSN